MADLRWTRRADQEVFDIADGIGRHNRRAGLNFVERVELLATLLREHPKLGARRDDIFRGARSIPFGPHLILYRVIPDRGDAEAGMVEIVSVVDGRRDLRRLF